MSVSLPWHQRPSIRALALFIFGCLLYVNTLGHDYALDDAIVITDNSLVQRGFAGVPELFKHDTFYGFLKERERAALVTGGRYRPLTPAMFAIEQSIAEGPFLHHLLNVLWYGLLLVAIYFLLRELDLPEWSALLAAALFAAHPLHTEAVANIKGRDEIVALLGVVVAAYLVLRAARRGRSLGAYAGAAIFFLGCLAKENAITFAAVIPLLLYVRESKIFRYSLPIIISTGLFLLLRYGIIGLDFGEAQSELMNNPFLRADGRGGYEALGFFDRLPTVLYTLLIYLKLLFVPTGLVHDYYPASIVLKGWGNPSVILSLLVHLALLIWSVGKLRTEKRLVAAGVLTYLITLSIVSNLFFSVGTFMSERFLFMPSFGFVLAIGGGVGWLVDKWKGWRFVLTVVVAIFAVLTVMRNPVWADNYTLFTTDLARQPNSAKLLNAAGGARIDRYLSLEESGRTKRQDLLITARRDLDRALQIHPRYRNAFLLRGNANLLLEDYSAAILDYDRAVELGDADGSITQNLVLALQRAGRAAGEQRQDLGAAIDYLSRADRLAPNDYETLRLLGVASGMNGQLDRALDYFGRAVELAPENAGALRNYGTALYRAGRLAEAEALFARAKDLE